MYTCMFLAYWQCSIQGWLVGCVLPPIDNEVIQRWHPHLLSLAKDVELGFYAVPTELRVVAIQVNSGISSFCVFDFTMSLQHLSSYYHGVCLVAAIVPMYAYKCYHTGVSCYRQMAILHYPLRDKNSVEAREKERCIYRASRPSQGTVNGGAVSK